MVPEGAFVIVDASQDLWRRVLLVDSKFQIQVVEGRGTERIALLWLARESLVGGSQHRSYG